MAAARSLGESCLYFVASRLSELPLASLCLLPLHLRRKLLRLLCAVDLWRLETSPEFTRGLETDVEKAWMQLLVHHVLSWGSDLEFKKQQNHGESYLTHTARVLLASGDSSFRQYPFDPTPLADKNCYVSILLHGVVHQKRPPPLHYVLYEFDPRHPTAWPMAVYISPLYQHLCRETHSPIDPLSLLSYFMEKSGWSPRLQETGCDGETLHDKGLALDRKLTDISSESFQAFMSHIEDINMEVRGKDSVLAALTALHVAVTESRQLKSLSIKATPNDLTYFLPKLAQSVHTWSAGSKKRRKPTEQCPLNGVWYKLKRVDIEAVTSVQDWPYPADLVQQVRSVGWTVLLCRDQIEEIRLQYLDKRMFDMSDYLLVHLICCRATLQRLELKLCTLRVTALEVLVREFLRMPENHPVTLDLSECCPETQSTSLSFTRETQHGTSSGDSLKTLCIKFRALGPLSLPWLLCLRCLKLGKLSLHVLPREKDLQEVHRILSTHTAQLRHVGMVVVQVTETVSSESCSEAMINASIIPL